MSCDENAMASVEQDLIVSELHISNNRELVAVVQEEITEKTELVTNYEISFNRNHVTIERKQTYMDECNKQLSRLLEKREVTITITNH